MNQTCPTDAALVRMLGDDLPSVEVHEVEGHIATCPACQLRLDRLTDPQSKVSVTDWSGPIPPLAGVVGWSDTPSVAEGLPPNPPGYRLERELGRGGMGVVYLAWQIPANRPVALKMVLGNRSRPEDLVRFRIEGESLARIRHPNIVQVHEVGDSHGQPFFSMEYIEGGTLTDAIRGASIPTEEAATLVATLARAIHVAHQCGVVHRDLKPANVLLMRESGSGSSLPRSSRSAGGTVPKITDFGLAKQVASESSLTQTGQILGTPSYMAPEQATSGSTVGIPADVYALGAILYEALCGRPPFRGGSPWETMMLAVHEPATPPSCWRSGLPQDLQVICLKCLAKAPDDRYASADALAEDLRRFLAGEPILARRSPPWEVAWKWSRRRPVEALAIAAALGTLLSATVGLAIGNVWLAAANRRADQQRDLATTSLARAEADYHLAHDAVDRFLGKVMDDRLLDEPFMAPLRLELVVAARQFYESLLRRRNSDPDARLDLARSQLNLARIVALADGPAAAIQPYEQARNALEETAQAGRDVESPLLLVAALDELGRRYQDVGRRPEAQVALDHAVTVGRQIVSNPTRTITARTLLVRVLADRGDLLIRFGRGVEAMTDLHLAVSIADELAAEKPDDPAVREVVVQAQGAMGQAAFTRGDFGDSIPWRERAVVAAEFLQDREPRSVARCSQLAARLADLGASYVKVYDLSHAEATLGRAANLLRALVRDHPTVADYENRLAACLNSLAITLTRATRWDDAETVNLEAITILERLATRYPEVLSHRLAVGSAYGNEGNFWLDRKQPARGLPWFDQSVATMEAILQRQAGDRVAQRVLRNSAWGQADVLIVLGRPDAALVAFDRGIAAAEGPAQLDMRLNRAACLALTGRADAAITETEAILADPLLTDPNHAWLFAVAARVPAAIAKSAGTDEIRIVQAPRALDWLHRTEATGYFRHYPFRAVEYRADSRLAIFRGLPEFDALMLDIAMPADPFQFP